ncbi:uncharacterized protein BYT42DRAFT_573836 [Radiomyces spectabilis]|uniref:uncharacterized protein n=1 Tax=Radiomyces spectabilis TaxID=64574 RepID=UPI00222008D1|nr:uncharacterized protein BYT42DRAFT_573836 [Radiomyces spectabilis]KAI8376225.1 hypothetical protein BYT42DRAFT_573836 [Radiomyces spectabilis]
MEAKVHEATNNEAWGASSTLMREIAQGTYNYQYFNEIMPTLYKRFTEKEARQWRQIYKALVLLEYLIKNGSERVVDDARSHISTVKIMRNFHYIDEKGKDQGINIRNRAKEIADLLSNTDLIKSERKKARQNRNKYTGVGSETMTAIGGGPSSGYSGFGSDSMYGMEGGMNGSSFYDEDDRVDRYGGGNKYDTFYEEEEVVTKSEPVEKKRSTSAHEASLFDFDDTPAPASSSKQAAATAKAADDDWGDFAAATSAAGGGALDDFDDFQSAVPSAAAPAPAAPAPKKAANLFDLLDEDSFTSPGVAPSQPAPPIQSQPPLFQTSMLDSPGLAPSSQPLSPVNSKAPAAAAPATNTTPKADLPSGMWSQASSFVSLDLLGKNSNQSKPNTGPSMNAMKNSSISAGWNNWASSNQTPPLSAAGSQKSSKSPFDDLLS